MNQKKKTTLLSVQPKTPQQHDDKLRDEIKRHEGKIPYAYQDSLGYWTIAYGRLIDKRKGGKLSDDEMDYLLTNDIKAAIDDLQPFSWYQVLDPVRQGVLIELVFNEGLPHLLGFQKMIAALKVKNYTIAAAELLDSTWARQVGLIRSGDMHYRLLTGNYQ